MVDMITDLLEAVEKELDDCMLKCTEWYGWHFPELKKLVPNSLIYARVVKQLGNLDFFLCCLC